MKYFLLFSISLLANIAQAQNGTPSVAGAYGAGMGDASATYTNIYSVIGNQAGMAKIEKTSVAVFADQRFLLPELTSYGAIAAIPMKKAGVFGVSINSFGDVKRYNETKIGLGYALKLADAISIGAQVDYLGTRIVDYGSNNSVTFELGVLARVMPKFMLGAHIYSPMRVRLTETELIPTVFSTGASYQPNEKVLVTAEYELDFKHTPNFKAGIDYKVAPAISLRAGVGTNAVRLSGGIGIHLKPITIDIAAQYHQLLGFTPSFGISSQF